jgi:hypothetical protein
LERKFIVQIRFCNDIALIVFYFKKPIYGFRRRYFYSLLEGIRAVAYKYKFFGNYAAIGKILSRETVYTASVPAETVR